MASAPTIDRPGVEIIQEFVSASATILKPTLPACIMGPCNQILEAVLNDGSLNPDARLNLPARVAFSFVGSPFKYTSIGTDILEVSVDNAAPVQITFPTGPDLTATETADAINTAAVPGLLAKVETSAGDERVVIYTDATGENASIQIGTGTSADVITAFGITKGYKNIGASGYDNLWMMRLNFPDYPDPREILSSLTVNFDTVRVFINDGAGNIREVLRTESFLDGATSAVSVQDDGDGDNLSPYLNFAAASFHTGPAVMTGTVDWTTLTYPTDFGTFTFKVKINGVIVTTTFSNPGSAAAAASAVNTALGANGTAVLNGSNHLVITSAINGASSSIEILNGTITETTLGFTVGEYAAAKPSKARARGTVALSGLSYPNPSGVAGRVLRMSLDGDQFQTLTFPTTGLAAAADIVTQINNLWGSIASLDDANNLVLISLDTFGGKESVIQVDKTASDVTLLTTLGLTTSGGPFETVSAVFGNALPPLVGDEVWVDGMRLGVITEVPTSPDNRLRISNEQLLSFTGATWYIIAKSLDNNVETVTRPSSDLLVDETSGAVRVKHHLFRDTAGNPSAAGPLATYLGYDALRLDVTPAGTGFNLLRFGSTTDLGAALDPINTENPLALGMYFALLNAPGIEVTGVGVDEVVSGDGTLESYTRSFEFLESKDVYAITPLTFSEPVGQVGQVHVDTLSLPENRLERILVRTAQRPSRKSDTLVASAPTANVSGPPTNVIASGIANLQALLAAAGKPGPSYTESDAVFVELEGDTNKYLVESVSGQFITINDGPLSASNTIFLDGGGSAVFTSAIVDRPLSVFILGPALATRTDEAIAYADIARGYLDRRVIVTAPDQAKASIENLVTAIPGYYLASALSGKMSAVSPSQPLTEESLAGFEGVIGATDRYSELQLKIMDGGGLWVFYQEDDGQPVKTRHQLTTDMSTVEKRETSITRALDFTAKFMRNGLRNFIGRFNITQNIQDAISLVIDGLKKFLIDNGVIKSFEVVSIQQSATEPDELDIIVDVGVLFPLNKIRMTLRV